VVGLTIVPDVVGEDVAVMPLVEAEPVMPLGVVVFEAVIKFVALAMATQLAQASRVPL
jgi:hypothetical protein